MGDENEFDDDNPTVLDEAIPEEVFREPSTEPHDTSEWLSGWSQGYGDASRNWEHAIHNLLKHNGAGDAERAALIDKLRSLVE